MSKGVGTIFKEGIFVTDNGVVSGVFHLWCLGTINKADDCPTFEVAEAFGLIYDRREVPQEEHTLADQLVDNGLVVSPDVEENIPLSSGH